MKKIGEINLLGIRYAEYKCPDVRVPGKCPNVYGCVVHALTDGLEGSYCIYIKRPK